MYRRPLTAPGRVEILTRVPLALRAVVGSPVALIPEIT
jgi:hypothetical protein